MNVNEQCLQAKDVLITDQLLLRNRRTADFRRENEAIYKFLRDVAQEKVDPLISLVELTARLTGAGSAGLSMLEQTADGQEIFRWCYLTGKFREYSGGTMPRDASPCGVTLMLNSPQLFSYPENFFSYKARPKDPIAEALIIPVHEEQRTIGTIWVVAHTDEVQFDLEDMRVMQALADFVVVLRRVLQSTQ